MPLISHRPVKAWTAEGVPPRLERKSEEEVGEEGVIKLIPRVPPSRALTVSPARDGPSVVGGSSSFLSALLQALGQPGLYPAHSLSLHHIP